MKDRTWFSVDQTLPSDGQLITARSANGNERELVRQNGLWFIPDLSMYVYFTPVIWSPVEL